MDVLLVQWPKVVHFGWMSNTWTAFGSSERGTTLRKPPGLGTKCRAEWLRIIVSVDIGGGLIRCATVGRNRKHDSPKRPPPPSPRTPANRHSAPACTKGNGILARHRECVEGGPEDSVGCEPSGMGDAFRPLSPAPFVAVTELADGPERERDRGRQNIGASGASGAVGVLLSFAAEHHQRSPRCRGPTHRSIIRNLSRLGPSTSDGPCLGIDADDL